MTEPKKPVFRLDDRVRIVTPTFVTRVGYPKAVSDYLPEVEEKFRPALLKLLEYDNEPTGKAGRALMKVYQELAYLLATEDGFGGKERSLHTVELPELVGQEFNVSAVKTVMTGTYYPPSGWYSWEGEYDFEPGGLSECKAHRLVQGFAQFGVWRRPENCPELWIEARCLEKVVKSAVGN